MAIQDDNTILNKGDLKAYHQKILPYLGGNMMVSTNNSDFYSTDEKVVGVWTDGKPVYQKTIQFSPSTRIERISHGITNLATVVGCTGTYFYNPGWFVIPRVDMSTTSTNWNMDLGDITTTQIVVILGNSVPLNNAGYITIQYTKTTDTAGSATTTPGAYDISFPNTWPENTEVYFGNGLYGKRITGSVTLVAGTRQDIIITSGISSSGKIISQGGTIKTPTDWECPVPWSYNGLSTVYEAAVFTLHSGNTHNLYIYTSDANNAGANTYDIWCTYTK